MDKNRTRGLRRAQTERVKAPLHRAIANIEHGVTHETWWGRMLRRPAYVASRIRECRINEGKYRTSRRYTNWDIGWDDLSKTRKNRRKSEGMDQERQITGCDAPPNSHT